MPGIPIAQELIEKILFMNTEPPYAAVSREATETTTFATAWARITETGGTKDNVDQEHQSQTKTFEIWCRYIDGVTAWMQISWGTRTLTLTGPPQKVVDRNNRRWMLIQATEITERSI